MGYTKVFQRSKGQLSIGHRLASADKANEMNRALGPFCAHIG